MLTADVYHGNATAIVTANQSAMSRKRSLSSLNAGMTS